LRRTGSRPNFAASLQHRECHASVLDGSTDHSDTDVTNHLRQRLPLLSAQSD
jgi:hypothetical protein